MTSEKKIEKLSKNHSIIEWIMISINQNKFISNAIIVGFVLWGINLIADKYNPPATQRQIDRIVQSNTLRDRRDSIEVISKALKVEELNHKMDLQNLKLEYVIKSQDETQKIASLMQSQLQFLNKNIKQGAFSIKIDPKQDSINIFAKK